MNLKRYFIIKFYIILCEELPSVVSIDWGWDAVKSSECAFYKVLDSKIETFAKLDINLEALEKEIEKKIKGFPENILKSDVAFNDYFKHLPFEIIKKLNDFIKNYEK